MLSKKQYYGMLVGGIVTFMVLFSGTYWYAQYTSTDRIQQNEKKIKPQSADTLKQVTPVEIEQDEDAQKHATRIGMNTKVIVDIINQKEELVGTEFFDGTTLLGYTKEDLQEHFSEYNIREFTDKEVVLERHIYQLPEGIKYKIGCENGGVGIVVVNASEKDFIPIGIPIDDFSVQTGELLQSEFIDITSSQKQMLEKDPYYIEQILQSYNE